MRPFDAPLAPTVGWVAARQRAGSLLTVLVSVIGVASFLYPFFLPALAGVGVRASRGGIEVSLLFTALGVAALVLLLATAGGETEGQGASKVVALLGVLVAIDATLRLVPTLLGASPIFLLIILVGFTFGADIGFLMGALTLAVSALITGGLGPWLPYQMLGAGWVGMTAGWLPVRGKPGSRRQILMLALFGALWGLAYGAILNLTEWPFAAPGLARSVGLYWSPGMGVGETFSTYIRYYLTTSLVYDAFRAAANGLLILALGRPILRLLFRFRTRFIWTPWQAMPAQAISDSSASGT